MIRYSLLACALTLSLGLAGRLSAAAGDAVLPETAMASHGLTQAWSVQMEMDGARSRITYAFLDSGTLFVQTDRATIQAYDTTAKGPNGPKAIWPAARVVGNPDYFTFRAGVSADFVAVVNGSHLYVLKRSTGEVLWDTALGGSPATGPAISQQQVYVPLDSGMVASYRLKPAGEAANKEPAPAHAQAKTELRQEKEKTSQENHQPAEESHPLAACPSVGRVVAAPVVIHPTDEEEAVAWPTDGGSLFIAHMDPQQPDHFTTHYRVDTRSDIAAAPAYLPERAAQATRDFGLLFTATGDGRVYAYNARTAEKFWEFDAGGPVVRSPVPIGEDVYICTQAGGMFCVDAQTGAQKWWRPRPRNSSPGGSIACTRSPERTAPGAGRQERQPARFLLHRRYADPRDQQPDRPDLSPLADRPDRQPP